MLYLTSDELDASHGGLVNYETISTPDKETALRQAVAAINARVNADLGYRLYRENRRWNGEDLELTLYHWPVRRIYRLAVVLGVGDSEPTRWDIPVAQTLITDDPTQVPEATGDVFVDASRNAIAASSWRMYTGTPPIMSGIVPRIQVLYTAGYDDTDPTDPLDLAGDGLKIVIPDWLKEVTRMVVVDILGTNLLAGRGLIGGLQEIRTADTLFRRPNIRSKVDLAIPALAADILQAHYRSSVA